MAVGGVARVVCNPTGPDGDAAGKWDLAALHEDGLPDTLPVTLFADRSSLELKVRKQMGEADESAGRWFFWSMVSMLLALVLVYILLHALVPGRRHHPDGHHGRAGRRGETTGVRDAATPHAKRRRHISANLDTVLAPMTRRVLWAREPWSFIEILFWALAGVIVNLIVKSGSYLRWHRFYREGLFLHWAQFFTAPIVVVVLVFLLSTVTFTVAIGGAGDVTLDLSDPCILAAVSFPARRVALGGLGRAPEGVGRLTGQVADEASDVAQKRK